MTPVELQKLARELEEEKRVIENELENFARKNPVVKGDYQTKFPTADQADTPDEKAHSVEEFEKGRSVEQNLEVKLKEIDKTLRKIKAGSYGLCGKCQSPIEEKRLQAMPIVQLCVACAKGDRRNLKLRIKV